ncbi:hypothetical protein FNL39_103125 [Nocardia caishijiensis]|uniref:Uncharacterized protein n=2 Tax=Nocardia caishijiensis TaxID=184756 RepID=A0ABQ6YN56_9NOCA|nr:hypothetical protein FNL39_103125 [Nocardia caishijiensis]
MTPTLSVYRRAILRMIPHIEGEKSMFSAALGDLLGVFLTLLDSMSGTIGL